MSNVGQVLRLLKLYIKDWLERRTITLSDQNSQLVVASINPSSEINSTSKMVSTFLLKSLLSVWTSMANGRLLGMLGIQNGVCVCYLSSGCELCYHLFTNIGRIKDIYNTRLPKVQQCSTGAQLSQKPIQEPARHIWLDRQERIHHESVQYELRKKPCLETRPKSFLPYSFLTSNRNLSYNNLRVLTCHCQKIKQNLITCATSPCTLGFW